jgi:chemotaxis protein MotA
MIHRLLGVLTLFASLGVVFYFEGQNDFEGWLRLLHWPAMVLTGFGPVGLILISYDWDVLSRTLGMIFGKSPGSIQEQQDKEAILLHRLSQTFYENGPEAFEQVQTKGLSEFVQRAIERLSVRMPMADIRELLLKERDRAQIRIVQCLTVISLGVKLAPSIGMLGTILGMVRLLANLQDPGHIGPHMSLALLTTFYGLFFSLVVWTPIQQKAERLFDLRLEGFDQTVRWVELMERRKPASYFADTVQMSEKDRDMPEKAAA